MTTDSENTPEQAQDKYYCYLYRDTKTHKVLYVGYATYADRALTPGHNEEVLALSKGKRHFDTWIAGPYESEEAARNIEAALVSAIGPGLNRIEQPGVKFGPLGLPGHLVGRRSMAELTVHDIGRICGGAIVVYCNFTSELKSGKPKLTLTNFSDEVVFANIHEHWYVKNFLKQWIANPESSPSTLVAVQGPTSDRMIAASAQIDVAGWATTPVAEWDKSVHRIPLHYDRGLDQHELRGRRANVKFGTGKANYVMIVDKEGRVLHGYRMKGKIK